MCFCAVDVAVGVQGQPSQGRESPTCRTDVLNE